MAYTYTKTKASITPSKIRREILEDVTITSQTLEGISWESPDTLKITFSAQLTGGEETALDTLVSGHVQSNAPSISLDEDAFRFFDDFVGELNTVWNKTVSGTGSLITSPTGDVDFGYVILTSGGNSGRSAELNWGGDRSVKVSYKPRINFRIKLVNTTDSYTRIGFYKDSDNYIIFDRNGTGNWYSRTKSGGTETANDLSVSSNTEWIDGIIFVESEESVKFYVDRVLKATNTTNIPTGSLEFSIKQETMGGASPVSVYLDKIDIWQER